MKKIIFSENAPGVVGPYSQAIVASGLVFTAGQIGIDPETGTLVDGSTADETKQTLINLRAVLTAAGSSMENVVKATIFLTNIQDYTSVNKVYASFFVADFPARSAIAVKELPAGAKVEIEMVALLN